ncbi:MAG: hypothetical protein HY645_02715 [Acidobacteria bacterium]|nr:hypothetical protein [Acidobacteriota bacterium]
MITCKLSKERRRKLVLSGITLFYFLGFDWWNWHDTARIGLFPRFLIYILLVQLLLSIAMFFLARYWPEAPPDLTRKE